MRKTHVFVFIVISFCIHSSAQAHTILASIDHDSGYVTGLATGEGQVWVVDSLTHMIYGYDRQFYYPTGTIPVIGADAPVGLAWSDSVLYYAEAGSAVIHGLRTDGTYIGYWDVSDSGVQDIVGIGHRHGFPAIDGLLVADDGCNVVWTVTLEENNSEASVDTFVVLPDTLVFNDNGGGGYVWDGSWLCCESSNPYETVQLWNSSGYMTAYIPLSSTCGIEQDEVYSDDMIWIYVPDDQKIYLDWYGMGVEDVSAPIDPSTTALSLSMNPFSTDLGIRFILPSGTAVRLDIFDLSGRHIQELFEGTMTSGVGSALWAPDLTVPDGCYLIVLDASGQRAVGRAVLLR